MPNDEISHPLRIFNKLAMFIAGILTIVHFYFYLGLPILIILSSVLFTGLSLFTKIENYSVFLFPILYTFLWLIIIKFFKRGSYLISGVTSLIVCVIAGISLYMTTSEVLENKTNMEQQRHDLFIGNVSPSSGLLVPSAYFVSSEFVKKSTYYRENNVQEVFESVKDPSRSILYYVTPNPYSPTQDIKPKPDQIFYFSHNGGEGEIIKLLGAKDIPGQMSYRIRWADGETKTVKIEIMHTDELEPPYQELIDLLDRLERVP